MCSFAKLVECAKKKQKEINNINMNNGSKDFFAFFKAVKNIAYRKSEKKEEKKTWNGKPMWSTGG